MMVLLCWVKSLFRRRPPVTPWRPYSILWIDQDLRVRLDVVRAGCPPHALAAFMLAREEAGEIAHAGFVAPVDAVGLGREPIWN